MSACSPSVPLSRSAMTQYPRSIASRIEKVEFRWPTMCLKFESAVKADVLFRIGSRMTARIASLAWP